MKKALIIVMILSMIKAFIPELYYACDHGFILIVIAIVAFIAYIFKDTFKASSKKAEI